MSFLTVVYEALALNFDFLIGLFTNHWFWLFGFMAYAYYVFDKKDTIKKFVIVVFYVYTSVDIATVLGWDFGLVPPHVMALGALSLATLTDNFSFFGKNKIYAVSAIFFIFFILRNAFGVFG